VTTPPKLLCTILLKCCTLIALMLLLACPLFGKRKDDVVVMTNGDKFTGEIKSLQYGELVFKSDYMKDSVHLDWKKVKTLQSKDTFIISLTNGTRVTGLIGKEVTSTEEGKDFQGCCRGIGYKGRRINLGGNRDRPTGIQFLEPTDWLSQLWIRFREWEQRDQFVIGCGRRFPCHQELCRVGDDLAVWLTSQCQEYQSLHL